MKEVKNSISGIVGQQIKRIRKEKKVTIEELASVIQKSASTVSKYENGSIIIDVETLVEIADALDVDTRDLIDTVSHMHTNASKTALTTNSFLQNPLLPSRLYVYQYDGRLKQITKSLLNILPPPPGKEQKPEVALYLNVPNFSKANHCRYYYKGTLHSSDTNIYFALENPFNPCYKASIYARNPYDLQHLNQTSRKFYGLFTGFSLQPFTPFSSKVLLSSIVLQEDDQLMADLTVDKTDFKLARKYNFFMLSK